MPQSRHPRAWVKDMRICANCGHPRHRHGGGVGRGGQVRKLTLFCVAKESETFLYPFAGKEETRVYTCGCRTFEPKEG